MADGPLKRITPMAETPWAVANATIVSLQDSYILQMYTIVAVIGH